MQPVDSIWSTLYRLVDMPYGGWTFSLVDKSCYPVDAGLEEGSLACQI